MTEELYGSRGIDTSYEREKFTYRPTIKYTKEQLRQWIRPEMQQSIERSRIFTISNNLLEYGELIQEIDQILIDLENRNDLNTLKQLKELLSNEDERELFYFEKQNSGYEETGDIELYVMLSHMKNSLETRLSFIDHRFRTQITPETDINLIQSAEETSISNWEQLEAKVLESYQLLAHHHEDSDEDRESNEYDLLYDNIEQLEKEKRSLELLHTSLADTSYVHRNRYLMFLEIIEKAKILVYNPKSLLDKSLHMFIERAMDLPDYNIVQTHLLMQFKNIREQLDMLKSRRIAIDDGKEEFASEKNYLHQQLELKTVEPIKFWLYDQEENENAVLDLFSEYMVQSISETKNQYEETLADLINFYKSETDFYEQQILLLKKKEEIRQFYRIFKDLGETEKIQDNWIDEYLKMNGYSSGAIS